MKCVVRSGWGSALVFGASVPDGVRGLLLFGRISAVLSIAGLRKENAYVKIAAGEGENDFEELRLLVSEVKR